jgi:uncharacterized protein
VDLGRVFLGRGERKGESVKYRSMGKVPVSVSALGFGCMRLPTLGAPEEVDVDRSIEMIRHAIDEGVNYCDSAYAYHGGASEPTLGRALAGGYRERVHVATKMPQWLVEKSGDFDRYFEEQCGRLQTERIDFYLLHNLREERWPILRSLGVADWIERSKASGRIGYIGFSFHESFPVFQEFIDSYDGWDFCQIQYNYMNEEVQAGTRGLAYAAGKGLGVVIMEPLLGGKLANPPDAVQRIMEAAPSRRTPAGWALQWLWNRPEISLVLSGMSTMEQVKENLRSASLSGVGSLTAEEMEVLEQARREFASLVPIPCTRCGYCMPCPQGVDIPRNLEIYNEGVVHSNLEFSKIMYRNVLSEKYQAARCVECRECEEKCPQQIEIADWMKRIEGELGGA